MPSPVPAPSGAPPRAGDAPRIDGRDVRAALLYAVVALALAAMGVTGGGLLAAQWQWSTPVSLTVLLIGCAAILWRRRAPMVTLVVTGLCSLLDVAFGQQITAYILVFEAMFEPVMHGSERLARITTGIGIALTAGVLGGALLLGVHDPALLLMAAMTAALVLLVPLLWGWEVRHHREARRTAESLAQAERDLAASQASSAVDAERRRIAHDLHDVITGHLSAVSLHTSLAESLPDDRARGASLRTARDSAHAALRDLRSMIEVLAEEGSSMAPSVTLDWPSLAERLRGRDPQAQVEIAAEISAPDALPPAIRAALLRIGAEAVTNAIRHGEAPMCLVVRREGEDVVLELENERAESSQPGTGLGRSAIAHRAAAVGGSAISEPVGGSRWRVGARLPLAATGPPPDSSSPSPSPSPSQEAPR